MLATAGVAGAGAGFGMPEATGAFIVCSALITLFGVTGWFEKLLDRIPMAIASALLAGVLTRFGLDAFVALKSALGLVLLMLVTYLVGRRFWARYAVPGVLLAGIAYAAVAGELHLGGVQWGLTMPVFTAPEFTWRGVVSLALPLFVVTMASQNPPRRRRDPRSGLRHADLRDHHAYRSRDAGARTVRCLRVESFRDHRVDLHGPRSTR